MEQQSPKVGIGVIIRKKGKVLLGKRKNDHGKGSRSLTLWHLEFKEGIEDYAKKITFQETGISIKDIRICGCTNDVFEWADEHYTTVFVICDYDKWEIDNESSEKFETWDWFDWNELPEPLFLPVQNLIKQSFHPFIN